MTIFIGKLVYFLRVLQRNKIRRTYKEGIWKEIHKNWWTVMRTKVWLNLLSNSLRFLKWDSWVLVHLEGQSESGEDGHISSFCLFFLIYLDLQCSWWHPPTWIRRIFFTQPINLKSHQLLSSHYAVTDFLIDCPLPVLWLSSVTRTKANLLLRPVQAPSCNHCKFFVFMLNHKSLRYQLLISWSLPPIFPDMSSTKRFPWCCATHAICI